MKNIGWHGITLFFHNYLSINGKNAQREIKPALLSAEKTLSDLLNQNSEHAISIINELDIHLVLLSNFTHTDAQRIN